MWQPVIGIVILSLSTRLAGKITQICAAGMTQWRKQDTAQTGRDDQVRQLPRRRYPPVDASHLAPGTIPFSPRIVPEIWVKALQQVGDFGERDLLGGKGGQRGDAGALLMFPERRLG